MRTVLFSALGQQGPFLEGAAAMDKVHVLAVFGGASRFDAKEQFVKNASLRSLNH